MAPTSVRQASTGAAVLLPEATSFHASHATAIKRTTGDWRAVATDEDLVIESWSQGFIVGALLIMACITIANMRRGVLLHKLILTELLLAMTHGTFCFMTFDGYGWYLSSTAALLYTSWVIHNVVSWLKVRPFFSQPGGFFKPALSKWVKRVYIGTLALSVPIIAFQVSDNFRFFNNRGGWYQRVRPYEPLMRDPWWVFTALTLFHVIRKCYGTGVIELIRRSPRFGILLSAICLSIVFTALDIVASISSTALIDSAISGSIEGINPWWKLSLVFKCLTDTIMLDDFKTELKRLGIKRIAKEEKRRNTISLVPDRHPLDGNESDDETKGSIEPQARGSIQWYNNSPLARTSTACDISPTTSMQQARKSSLVDPRESSSWPPNDPNTDMEELEFSTALLLGPSRLSGVNSVGGGPDDEEPSPSQRRSRRDQQERESITTHTKRISKLPDLAPCRFESIKPGPAASTPSLQHTALATNPIHIEADTLESPESSDHNDQSGNRALVKSPDDSRLSSLPEGLRPSESCNSHNGQSNHISHAHFNHKIPHSTAPVAQHQTHNHQSGFLEVPREKVNNLDDSRHKNDASEDRIRRFKNSIGA